MIQLGSLRSRPDHWESLKSQKLRVLDLAVLFGETTVLGMAFLCAAKVSS
jgi:hypothetical protein